MIIPNLIETARLTLQELQGSDSAFILELLNTPGWLRFIGDRKVTNLAEASAYITKIKNLTTTQYRTVKITATQEVIGVVTLIKRHYLDYHDLGFAFLPQYSGMGYAQEAAQTFVHAIFTGGSEKLYAITNRDNHASIKLLEKLGFGYLDDIQVEGDKLKLYGKMV